MVRVLGAAPTPRLDVLLLICKNVSSPASSEASVWGCGPVLTGVESLRLRGGGGCVS